MDTTFNPDDYVFEHDGRFVVAQQVGGAFCVFQRPAVQMLTGCSITFGPLEYVAGGGYTFKSRASARRKARELYGRSHEDDRNG